MREDDVSELEVLVFGAVRDVVGGSTVRLEVALPCTAGDVMRAIETRFEAMHAYSEVVRVAVNRAYVGLDHEVRGGDEVAIIPPVSGG